MAGLWSAAASWIKEGPGVGRAVAEWMSGQEPEIDIHEADIARFYPCQRTVAHVQARAREGFNKMYGIVHPAEQWESGRPVRVSPVYHRERELGAVFFETAGWERPHWYASNEALLERYAGRLMPREAEWEARWWSPIINAEHLAMRDACGLIDLSAFAVFDITGPAALETVQSLAVAQLDVAPGRVVYTSLLDERGGFKADLTIMRLGAAHFRVVTGGATGMAEKKWFTDHLPADGTAALADLTSAWTTLGLWGPRARDVMQAVSADDYSHPGFPFGTCREVEVGGLTVLASRISYVGELGWELYVPMEQGARLWDALWEAGAGHGLVPVGIGVYGTTGRLEKGYRAYGNELTADYNLVEAGMTRPKVKKHDVHRQGRLPGTAGGAAGGGDVHADRGRPPVGQRPAALHARRRAHPLRGRRAAGGLPGPPLVRDQRGLGPLHRQAPADGLPARRAGHGRGRACSPSTSASGIRSRSPSPARRRCSTRETSGSGVRLGHVPQISSLLRVRLAAPRGVVVVSLRSIRRDVRSRRPRSTRHGLGDGDPRLRQARPAGRRQDRGDRRRAGRGHPDVGVRREPA